MDFVMHDSPIFRDASTAEGHHHLRVLVADDDPASRRFLGDGLRSLGALPHACADGEAALACARSEAFDLLLLDCRMPGAGARQVLDALRNDPEAASSDSVAVATSAELSAEDRRQLLRAGFSDVLLKPCNLQALQRLLSYVQPGSDEAALLDDDAALISTGDVHTMRALRGLLRQELTDIHRELEPLSGDPTGFAERLHRLRSSCGFCGAVALSTQVVALHQQLTGDQTGLGVALMRFRKALTATITALDRSAD
jgi:CheY-like chemotaxis protein